MRDKIDKYESILTNERHLMIPENNDNAIVEKGSANKLWDDITHQPSRTDNSTGCTWMLPKNQWLKA